MDDSVHQSHSDVTKRLKRAEGHLRKIVVMIEEHRPCSELAQQLQEVESAIRNATRVLIRDHIDPVPPVSNPPPSGE